MADDFPLASSRALRAGLFLLSAAVLAYEINLTRLFSVTQFYHFAFMIVSLALLGFGASGSFLAFFPRLGWRQPWGVFSRLALGCAVAMLIAYLLVNLLPFDSFSLALDHRQPFILGLHYLALGAPFFFCGLATSMLLSTAPDQAGGTYAANLAGSAAGCALALLVPAWVGGVGLVILCSGLAALSGVITLLFTYGLRLLSDRGHARMTAFALLVLLFFAAFDLSTRLTGVPALSILSLQISPYKSLSYALQYPGAQIIHQRWNAFSRLDRVRSPGIRSLPGLSYRYSRLPPPEDGLLIDADELSPLLLPAYDPIFVDSLLAALPFQLRPAAQALILEPRGGLDIVIALESGAFRVVAVEANPLIVDAAGEIYSRPGVDSVVDSGRSYLRRSQENFDVVVLSLASSYHPVRSGAYSLGEDYRYTVEAFQDAYARLSPDGLLVVARWLQTPPSEELRAFALAVTALENSGRDPRRQIVALRSFNTALLLVRRGDFTLAELRSIRQFAAARAFDLIYVPGLLPEEANRYNRLPQPVYYEQFTALLDANPRRAFYDAYPYEVSPPTDDRPFFSHFFKWSQAGQVWAELGKTWQPFGGAGYFVILALLVLSTLLAGILILLPALAASRQSAAGGDVDPQSFTYAIREDLASLQNGSERLDIKRGTIVTLLTYFALIGLAYLLVEIPLLQRFILFLGQPAYAMSVILAVLLLFSGLGSQVSGRMGLRRALPVLLILLVAGPQFLPFFFDLALGWSLPARLLLTCLLIAPLGFLMGLPLPGGIAVIAALPPRPGLIAWAWAVNGAASVIASVLAALLALTFGFNVVLYLGAGSYAIAWVIVLFLPFSSTRLFHSASLFRRAVEDNP